MVTKLYSALQIHVKQLSYIFIDDSITVCVMIAGITRPVPVCVLLAGVRGVHTVVLETAKQNSENTFYAFNQDERLKKYLFTIVVSALELVVRIPINICVLPTHIAITGPTNSTLTPEQRKEKKSYFE